MRKISSAGQESAVLSPETLRSCKERSPDQVFHLILRMVLQTKIIQVPRK